MRTLLLFLLMVSAASAQMKIEDSSKWQSIGKNAPIGSFHSELEKNDNVYRITYRDVEFPNLVELKSFDFEASQEDLEQLYQTMLSGFDTMEEKDITFADDKISLQYVKSMGVVGMRFFHADLKTAIVGRSDNFSKKQLAKLFGKSSKR
jgi:uncharacterized protein YuzE